MTQENQSEITDDGVAVTTTPKSSVSVNASAKLSAAAETATAFNIKSETSITAFDTYKIGCLGMSTSKKLGANVTYQCGKNTNGFSTTSKDHAHVYAKTLTFAYEKGLALRGQKFEIINKTDLAQYAAKGLLLLTAGSVVAPVVPFGLNHTGQSEKWETSSQKKKRIKQTKLDKKKNKIDEIDQKLEKNKDRINELEAKQAAGTLTSEEEAELKKYQADKEERDSAQKDVDEAAEEEQKKKDTEADIGGSLSAEKSLEVTNKASFAGMGTSGVASVATAIAAAGTIFGKASESDSGISMTASDGDFVINATAGYNPVFSLTSYSSAALTDEQASLEIKQPAAEKVAEFSALDKFTAKSETGCLESSQLSVNFGLGSNSVKISDAGTDMTFGSVTMKVSNSGVKVTVESLNVEFLPNSLKVGGVEFKG